MKTFLIPLVGLLAAACSSNSTDNGTASSGTSTTTSTTTPATTPPATTASTTTTTTAATGGFGDVVAVATANCMPCHSAQKKAGGLSLASYDDLMKGGSDGPVVKAGDPDHSLLVEVLKGPTTNPKVPQMPMKRPPLQAGDIQKVSDWVKSGAKNS